MAAFEAGDYATAFVEFSELAELGDAAAQYNLALMYEAGNGVEQNKSTATNWYVLAAEQGSADAQVTLSMMYYGGMGITQNFSLAHM